MPSITESSRVAGPLSMHRTHLQTHQVPIPASTSHQPSTPILSAEEANQGNVGHHGQWRFPCWLHCCDAVPKDINTTGANIKSQCSTHSVDWCPNGFKVGINYQPHNMVPTASCQHA